MSTTGHGEPAPLDPGSLPVLPVGICAERLEDLGSFFAAVPPHSGLAFVVLQPEGSDAGTLSEMTSATSLVVQQVHDSQPLEANHVYVSPPGGVLTVQHDRIRVNAADRHEPVAAVDRFFESLAAAEGERAIAVVLSEHERTAGARVIKAAGGLVVAQAPGEDAHVVLPPDRMSQFILDHVRRRNLRGTEPPVGEAEQRRNVDFFAILAALRDRTKYDLRAYKTGTLRRRIERRMRAQKVDDFGEYLTFLQSHPLELDRLAKELLVGVTAFFRDAPAFEALAGQALPDLTRRRDIDTPIRVWVPACSTGQEAYSIAMVLAEQIAAANSTRRIQIFASDVDEEALSVARAGRYPESIAKDVSADRLRRFFTHEDRHYTIVKGLRESVFFATQNLTVDPPFARLDLISCRNLLIYLEPEAQEKLLSLFHFALNPGGFLFLGSAEGVGPLDERFGAVSKRWRIFRRLAHVKRPSLAVPPLLAASPIDLALATMAAEESQLPLIRQLRAEVAATRKEHQSLLEQLAASNTELKAANEEILAMNEELQSINQELTASKDALQFMNEELTAVNARAAGDLRRMTQLHDLSMQAPLPGDVRTTLENVLRVAVDVTGADRGTVQCRDDAAGLKIVAHVGFERPFLEFFARVEGHTDCACGAAMACGRRVIANDVNASPLFADPASSSVLAAAGVRAVQSTPLFDRAGRLLGMLSTHYRAPHQFDAAELRWLDLLARHAADAIERQQTTELLEQSRRDLETRVSERTRWLLLMHDVTRAINEATTWDGALYQVLRRVCQAEDWQVGFLYLPQPQDPDCIGPVVSCFSDDRFRAFHDLTMRRTYRRGELLPGWVYADTHPFWAEDTNALLKVIPIRAAVARSAGLRAGVALPVAVGGEIVAVLELFSDRPHPANEQLASLMHDVGDQISRVLERERATARMAELVWREQQDLLHTLHDSLGQTLTGIGMLSTGLNRRLVGADADTASSAAEIARQTQQALDHVRLLARNLFPVEVDAESLMTALRDLASATESLHSIHVRVEGKAPASLHDGKIATELYRIAQEAVTNSVKHANAKGIAIRLTESTGLTRLQIADDGVGIAHPDAANGAGLRIMRYRAASIGASLTIERGAAGGTSVTCTLRESPVSRRGVS